MVGIILASHGDLAKGIKQSGSMVYGEQEDVAVVSLKPNEGPDDFRKKLERAIKRLSNQEEVLILADLWGGTPFNQSSQLVSEHKSWACVTGLNLPMLIEAYTARLSQGVTAHEIAQRIFIEARKGVRIKPEDLQPKPQQQAQNQSDTSKPSAIPEGTVLGDGQMQLVHVRIDSRLLHGQVAMNWARNTGCDRIIVVSDSVAHDEMRKTLITQAAPPGIKANVTTIKNMIRCYNDPRFGATKAFLIFENPEDALATIEGGVDIKHINVGSMAHSAGKTLLNKTIAVDKEDVASFVKMRDLGVTFDTKQVPSSSSEDLFELMKKSHVME